MKALKNLKEEAKKYLFIKTIVKFYCQINLNSQII